MKLVLSFFLLVLSSHAFAAGGIIRNGEVLSIGSSGVQIALQPLQAADLPELALVSTGLRQLVLPVEILGRIQKEMRPSPTRRFYRVNKISIEEERALVEEYRKLFPELPDSDRFTLVAMTNPTTEETYLLPAFAQLKSPSQRAAVLFHEGLYASGLVVLREYLVALEGHMEAALACTASCEMRWDDLQVRLTSNLDYSTAVRVFLMLLQRAAVGDAKAGQLTGILSPAGDLNFAAFLGDELFAMLEADLVKQDKSSFPVDYRETRLAELAEKWPRSRFVRILQNCPYNLTFVRHTYANETAYNGQFPSLEDKTLSPVGNWKLRDMNVRFSLKTLTYRPEIDQYYLRDSREEGEDRIGSAKGLRAAVQAVDANIPSKGRKVYVTKVRQREDSGWGSHEDNYWNYSFYFFGFSLN